MNFQQKVWELTKQIPAGKVTTYKEIAHALHTKAYRAVGQALNKNPFHFLSSEKTVPCLRVVMSNGCLGGFVYGRKKKKALLEKEGVCIVNNTIAPLERHLVQKKEFKN